MNPHKSIHTYATMQGEVNFSSLFSYSMERDSMDHKHYIDFTLFEYTVYGRTLSMGNALAFIFHT